MLQPKGTDWLNGLKTNQTTTTKDPYICLQEKHFRPKDTYRLKVRGWEKTCKWEANESWGSNPHMKQNRP